MVALVNSFGRKINDIGGGSVAAPTALPNTDQSRNYNLDGTGNWKNSTFTPVGGSQTTDQRSNNQLNQITQRTVGTGSLVKFQYDGQATPATGNGNLTNDGTLIYQYDALNRLIQVNRASDGLAIATYVYDAGNRRVRKTVTNGGVTGNIPNGTTDSLWQDWQTMEERNPFGGSGSTDTPIKQFIWGTYIDECLQVNLLSVAGPQSLPAGAYYLLQDLLYRAVALTNSSGAIVEAYDTDAYGNTLIFTGPGADGVWFTDDDVQSNYGANGVIYCGYRYDAETENYYVRNRYYSPTLGRWVTRDPIGYEGGINLYGYVESSPVGALDKYGLNLYSNDSPSGFGERKAIRVRVYRRPADLHGHPAVANWNWWEPWTWPVFHPYPVAVPCAALAAWRGGLRNAERAAAKKARVAWEKAHTGLLGSAETALSGDPFEEIGGLEFAIFVAVTDARRSYISHHPRPHCPPARACNFQPPVLPAPPGPSGAWGLW